MVEAAGVEPDIGIDDAQLTDSKNACIGANAMISRSTGQSLYKD